MGQRKEESAGQVPLQEGYPGGMLSRVDIGTFPSSRWHGVIIISWASGWLALRAALADGKEGKAVPSLLLNGLRY